MVQKNTPKRKKYLKRFLYTLLFIFLLMNFVAYFHAYKFTHFSTEAAPKTNNPEKLSTGGKLSALFFGVNNPRPENDSLPMQEYQTIILQSNKKIESWHIQAKHPKGTVILFHGYGGNKSSMLDKSNEFLRLGYNTLLVDFMGSGGSEGSQTTIGFKEAAEVKTCFSYLQKQGEQNIYLFGTSMGAVAILKALNDFKIQPKGIMIECPFGSMYQTTCARFKIMKVPTFPMAGLLVFWGGVQNGFNGFSHQPEQYAKAVHCPTLLMYGEKDPKVSRSEIDAIYQNLAGPKKLRTYPIAGHENYLNDYKTEWIADVSGFLSKTIILPSSHKIF